MPPNELIDVIGGKQLQAIYFMYRNHKLVLLSARYELGIIADPYCYLPPSNYGHIYPDFTYC
jgi:hypothetical protein